MQERAALCRIQAGGRRLWTFCTEPVQRKRAKLASSVIFYYRYTATDTSIGCCGGYQDFFIGYLLKPARLMDQIPVIGVIRQYKLASGVRGNIADQRTGRKLASFAVVTVLRVA